MSFNKIVILSVLAIRMNEDRLPIGFGLSSRKTVSQFRKNKTVSVFPARHVADWKLVSRNNAMILDKSVTIRFKE
jgi:hypothetical protein